MRKPFWPVVLIAALVALIVTWVMPHGTPSAAANAQPAFERVTRTRTLRCGWINYPPCFMKDPNTGKFSGIFYDLTEALAAAMNLKVEYTTETSFGMASQDLAAGRFDLVCSNLWPSASRALAMEFATPVSYSLICAYVRANDHRFDKNLDAMNRSEIKLASMDGEMASIITRADFPQAQEVALPHNAEIALLIENVVTSKADGTFLETAIARQWLEKNPGTIRNPAPERPVRVFGNCLAFAKGETQLRDAFNLAIEQLLNSGTFAKIEAKYAKPGDFYPVALPYGMPTASPSGSGL